MIDARLEHFSPEELRAFADQLFDAAANRGLFARVAVAFKCREIRYFADLKERANAIDSHLGSESP